MKRSGSQPTGGKGERMRVMLSSVLRIRTAMIMVLRLRLAFVMAQLYRKAPERQVGVRRGVHLTLGQRFGIEPLGGLVVVAK
jgi:hypothetical protein